METAGGKGSWKGAVEAAASKVAIAAITAARVRNIVTRRLLTIEGELRGARSLSSQGAAEVLRAQHAAWMDARL